MDTDTSNLQSLAARVKRLEQQNRMLKRGGLVLLLSASALILMGQARSRGVIEANDFLLKDAKGNVKAELGLINGQPVLSFYDSKSKVNGFVSPDALTFYGTSGTPIMILDTTRLSFQDQQGQSLMVADAAGFMISSAQGHISLQTDSGGGSLTLSDSRGFSTTIGNPNFIEPLTGESRVTSAASIRMFNEKGNVIWSTP